MRPVPDIARRYDLHLHTVRSDGRFSAEEVLERCAAGGLEVVAVTDHDLPSDIAPGRHRFGSRELHLVAGTELSGVHQGEEYHLLVYFPWEVPTAFRDLCRQLARARARRYEQGRASLGLDGVPPAGPVASSGDRALTRHHLARALVAAGHTPSVGSAFSHYLGDEHGHVPPVELPFVEAIRFARSQGGLTAWAHPPLQAAQRCLSTFVQAGLQGVEVYRPRLSRRSGRGLLRLARQWGLWATGGSDWHGWHDPELGLFSVEPQQVGSFLEALHRAA